LRWLHISDLHYEPQNAGFDTNEMLINLKKILRDDGCKPVDEVFFTGDFRFAKTQTVNFEVAARELYEIANAVGVDSPEHIHIVPGNHDLERGDLSILKQVIQQYNNGTFEGSVISNGSSIPCHNYLLSRLEFFSRVSAKLKNSIWTDIPNGLIHRAYDYGQYAIVYLNTAVACGQDNERGTLLIGYNDLGKALKSIPKGKPIIALGHHGLECLKL